MGNHGDGPTQGNYFLVNKSSKKINRKLKGLLPGPLGGRRGENLHFGAGKGSPPAAAARTHTPSDFLRLGLGFPELRSWKAS